MGRCLAGSIRASTSLFIKHSNTRISVFFLRNRVDCDLHSSPRLPSTFLKEIIKEPYRFWAGVWLNISEHEQLCVQSKPTQEKQYINSGNVSILGRCPLRGFPINPLGKSLRKRIDPGQVSDWAYLSMNYFVYTANNTKKSSIVS